MRDSESRAAIHQCPDYRTAHVDGVDSSAHRSHPLPPSAQVTVHHEADGWIMCSTEAGRRGLVPASYIRITATKPRLDPFAVSDDPFGSDDPFAGKVPAMTSDLNL